MSVQSWAAHWRDELVALRRTEEPSAFTGAQAMQLAPLAPGQEANRSGRVAFEHGVLALFDERRREVLLAAVPVWSGGLWVPSNAAEQRRLTASIEGAAARNGLGIAVLPGEDGVPRTVYTRAVPLGEAWLDASEPAWQFSVGIGGFTGPGSARAQDFADSVARAASAFLADEAYPAAREAGGAAGGAAGQPVGPAGAQARSGVQGSRLAFDEEPDETPLAPPPAAGSRQGTAAGEPSATGARPAAPRRSRRVAVITAAAAAVVVIGVLAAVGFSRGYSVEIVDREARAETFSEVPTGLVDLEEREDQRICGDLEAYQMCVDLHAELYRANCERSDLTASADELCADLEHFVSDSQRKSDECGEDCYTSIDEDGLWGWPRLRVVPETRQEPNGDGVERAAHTEYCRFDLGPIQIGTCTK